MKKIFENFQNMKNFFPAREVSTNRIFLTHSKFTSKISYIHHILYGVYEYFKNPINFFCLLIACGQVYEYKDYRSLGPLTLFCLASTIIYFKGILSLLKEESSENNKRIMILKKDIFLSSIFSDIQLDYTICIMKDSLIPADLLILSGDEILVSELNLTGEDIVISKNKIGSFDFPSIDVDKQTINGVSYTDRNILFRGTQIVDMKNTMIYGIPIRLGNNCKIYNIKNNTKNKTDLQKKLLKTCIINIILMLLLAILFSLILYCKDTHTEKKYRIMISNIRKMILLLNTMVPLSLQFFFNSAALILSKRIEKENKVKINTINCFQNNPHYIVSDKTGTITTGNLKVTTIETSEDNYNVILNILACSEIKTHSVTNKILKTDPIEEALLNDRLHGTEISISNTDDLFTFKIGNEITYYPRKLYKSYNYKTEVKTSIILNSGHYELHLQGTVEAINKYSLGKLTPFLDKVNLQPKELNSYRRIIAHGKRGLTEDEFKIALKNPEDFFKDLEYVSLYVLSDYVVEGINKSIKTLLQKGKDITLLTGDSQKSALEICETIGLLGDHFIIIDELDDFPFRVVENADICYIINGRLLEFSLSHLKSIIETSNRRIIYRSSPKGKQLFIGYLQTYFDKPVMMIGDGSNDVAALIQSDIGLAVKNGNNINVQNISDIIIESWNIIPELLSNCKTKNTVMINITHFVLLKHHYSVLTLIIMFFISNFSKIRDPASPFLMSLFNGTIFIYMCVYSQYIERSIYHANYDIKKLILFNMASSIPIFLKFEVNYAIKLIIFLQILYLSVWLNYLYVNNNRLLIVSLVLNSLWLFYIIF